MKLNTIALAAMLALGGAAFAAGNGASTAPTPDSSTKMQSVAKQGSDARESGNAGSSATTGDATGSTSGKSSKHASKKSKKHHAARHASRHHRENVASGRSTNMSDSSREARMDEALRKFRATHQG